MNFRACQTFRKIFIKQRLIKNLDISEKSLIIDSDSTIFIYLYLLYIYIYLTLI